MQKRILPIILLLSLVLQGCYWNEKVTDYEVGLVFNDGSTLDDVVGAGWYSGEGLWSEFEQVNVATITDIWSDPSLTTSDKQIIGATVGITYRRSPRDEDVRRMYSLYNAELYDNAKLKILVDSKLARAAKLTTSEFTLDEMLGTGEGDKDRASLALRLSRVLSPTLAEAGIELIDIGFNDIAPSPTYLETLDAKAKASADRELSVTNTYKLEQQLKQQQAQSAIDLEKARSEQDIALLSAKVLDESPAQLRLEMAKLYVSAIKGTDKVFFMQPGTDLSMFFGGAGAMPAIVANEPITQ